jgi:hypothetical protein
VTGDELIHILELIVNHHPMTWRHIPTGETHRVVWASPREIVSVSESSAWLGRAVQFVREFEAIDEP